MITSEVGHGERFKTMVHVGPSLLCVRRVPNFSYAHGTDHFSLNEIVMQVQTGLPQGSYVNI